MTKTVHVQIQPERSPDLDVSAAVERLRRLPSNATLAEAVVVTEGNDEGTYINIDFSTDSVPALWAALFAILTGDASLAACTIVCSEGSRGWKDYLLLHHFNRSEPLDLIAANRSTRLPTAMRGTPPCRPGQIPDCGEEGVQPEVGAGARDRSSSRRALVGARLKVRGLVSRCSCAIDDLRRRAWP